MDCQEAYQPTITGSLLRLEATARCRCVVRRHMPHWPTATIPSSTNILDSKGPFFLEFLITAASSPDGMPCIGLVDVPCLQAWPPGFSGAPFAIACNPLGGDV